MFFFDFSTINYLKKNNRLVSKSFKTVSIDVLLKLFKKFQYDNIMKKSLKHFELLYLSTDIISMNFDRIFILYRYLKRFLSVY